MERAAQYTGMVEEQTTRHRVLKQGGSLRAVIPQALHGQRLDQALAVLFADFSRSRLQAWVRDGRVQMDGQRCRNRDRVAAGQDVELRLVPECSVTLQGEDLPLELVHEDADLVVVDKAAGMVVHPAAGNPSGTLVNALLHRYPELGRLPRAGLVHRLDKDTTGLLVVARSERAHAALVRQLQDRSMSRQYLGLVRGSMVAGTTIDAPLGRHPVERKRMAVIPGGRPAITHLRIHERFKAHTLLSLRLETGRTHQIRVHLAHIRHPLVGDPVYGGRLQAPAGISAKLRSALRSFPRQALHACRLGLVHPGSGESMEWRSDVPNDLQALLATLRADVARDGEP